MYVITMVHTWNHSGSVSMTTSSTKFEIRHPISETANEAKVILVAIPQRENR